MQHLLFRGILIVGVIFITTFIFIQLIIEKQFEIDSKKIEKEKQTKLEKKDRYINSEHELIRLSTNVLFNNSNIQLGEKPLFLADSSMFSNQSFEYNYHYQFQNRYVDFDKHELSHEIMQQLIDQNQCRNQNQNQNQNQKEKEEEKEGFDDREGFEDKIARDIAKAFMKPLQPLIDFIDKIKDAFESIPVRVDNFNKAFTSVGYGIEKEFENIGKSLDIGIHDIFDLTGAAGKCGIKFASNFKTCFFWYIINIIYSTLHGIFIELPVFILRYFVNIDIREYIDDLGSLVSELDEIIVEITSFSFLRFPDYVIDQCFSCSIDKEVRKLKDDFEITIPELMKEPNQLFENAKNQFRSVFN